MRVLLVYSSDHLPSSRIRVLQLAPHWAAHGIEPDCFKYPHTVRAKLELRRSFQNYDLVMLQKKVPSRGDGTLVWQACQAPLLFDFDDAIMYLDEPVDGSYESPRRRARFDRIIERADAVICGNAFLAGHCTEKRTLIAPSPVPHEVPQRRDRDDNGKLRVGWVGGKENLTSLEPIAGALRTVSTQTPFELVTVSDAA